MNGWILPPPREPTKSSEEFAQERAAKVQELLLDRIAITAAFATVPPELIEQLSPRGRLIAPSQREHTQELVLLERGPGGLRSKVICEVLYVPLQGAYG